MSSRWQFALATASVVTIIVLFVVYKEVSSGAAGVTDAKIAINVLSESVQASADQIKALRKAVIESARSARDAAGQSGQSSTTHGSDAAAHPTVTGAATHDPNALYTPNTVYQTPMTDEEIGHYQACVSDPRGLNMDWGNFAGAPGHNGEIRFEHPMLDAAKTVIEVGGNIGVDAKALLERYHPRMFIFEPIPTLCEKLGPMLKDYDVTIKCYGLGGLVGRDATFALTISDTHSQGDAGEFDPKLSVPNSEELHPHITVKIKAYHEAMRELGLKDTDVNMININCEGCEYELMDYLLSTGVCHNLEEIQMAWHPLGGVGNPMQRRCRIRTLLRRTHKMMYSFWNNWESWARKDLSSHAVSAMGGE